MLGLRNRLPPRAQDSDPFRALLGWANLKPSILFLLHKCWEIIADNLKKAGWSLGWVSVLGSEGRVIWIVDAHRDNGKKFVVRSDEKLTAFLELEAAPRGE